MSFETKDSGERAEYASGFQRDSQDGKTQWDLVPDLMLQRIADLFTRGAAKYGQSNWRLANTEEELLRFKKSAFRHFMAWKMGFKDEDHAAAACANIMMYEELLAQIGGDALTPYDFLDRRLPQRFWDKVKINPETGCWEWTASKHDTGYGAYSHNGKTTTAHSVAWEAYEGARPPGMHIDHLCRVKHCVSPYHLELVTPAENQRRGLATSHGTCRAGHPKEVGARCLTCSRTASGWKGNLQTGDRMECPEGHPYDGENTWVEPSTGRRRCKVCKRETQRRYREKKQQS